MEPQIQDLVPARNFPFFPRLPPELRWEIWLHTIPKEPRLIPHAPHQKLARKDPSRAIYFCINRESRSVYLKKYTLCFPESHNDGLGLWSGAISPYANLDVDLFYWEFNIMDIFDSPSRWRSLAKAMNGLQHLAINVELLDSFSLFMTLMSLPPLSGIRGLNGTYSHLKHYIYQFKDLKTLTIVEEFERVSSRDEGGAQKDTSQWYRECREENEAQRNLDGREIISISREDKEEDIAWFAELLKQRPEWKAPELRFMRIEKSSNVS